MRSWYHSSIRECRLRAPTLSILQVVQNSTCRCRKGSDPLWSKNQQLNCPESVPAHPKTFDGVKKAPTSMASTGKYMSYTCIVFPIFLKLNQLWQFLLGSQIYSVERPTVRKADHLMAENRYSNSSQWCLARSRCGHNDSGSVASFWTSVAPFCLRSNHLTWLKTQVVGHRQFMAKSSWPYSSVWLMISLFVDWLRAIWYKPAWRQSRMAESIYYAYDAVVCVTCWVNDQNR